MEPSIPISFVTWLLGFLAVLLGGCWAIFKYFEAQLKNDKKETIEQLKTLYRRMDENKVGYYNDFVLVKVFKESNDARKEITDEKFNGLIQIFNEKIESLRSEIKNINLRNNNHS